MRPYSHFHFMVWLEKDDPTIGDDPSLVTQFYFKDETPPFPEVLQLEVTEVDYSRFNYGSYVNGTIVVEDASAGGTTTTALDISPTQPQGPFYPTTDFFASGNDLTRTLTDASIASSGMPTITSVESPTTPFPTLQTPVPSPETTEADTSPLPTTTLATPFPTSTPDTAEEGTKFPTTPFPTLETISSSPSTKYPTTPFPTIESASLSKAPSTSVPSSLENPSRVVSNDGVASVCLNRWVVAVTVSFVVYTFSPHDQ